MIKKTKRFIAVIICCTVLLVPFGQINAIEQTSTTIVNSVQIPNELENVLDTYFDTRNSTNPKVISSELEDIVIQGIINDEIERAESIFSNELSVISNSYIVTSYIKGDVEGEISVTESITYSDNVFQSYEILHKIYFSSHDDINYLLLSDSYREEKISFESCSYIPYTSTSGTILNNIMSTNDSAANTHVNTGDYAYDIVQIALTQYGYIEKATNSQLEHKTANAGSNNYTKYGEWYGVNGKDWCVMFVYWCSRQALIDKSVIPRAAGTGVFETHFIDKGQYYPSQYEGGTYTPKIGDIFFAQNREHVGLVAEVTDTSIITIEGNFSQRVTSREIALTSTYLEGFGSPIYPTSVSDHNYVCTDSAHEDSTTHVCSYCGNEAVGNLECAHSGTITQSCDLCDYSRVVTWGNHNDSNMIHSCPFCDVTQRAFWNCSHDGAFTRSCTLCDVTRPGIWLHVNDATLLHICSVCDETKKGSWFGDHTGTPEHTCTLCGYISQSVMADPVYDHDSTYHWYKCQICNDAWDYQTHSCEMTDRGHICIVCERFWPFGVMDIPNLPEIE